MPVLKPTLNFDGLSPTLLARTVLTFENSELPQAKTSGISNFAIEYLCEKGTKIS